MATSCTFLLVVPFLVILSASVADASIVQDACAKTPHQDYCTALLTHNKMVIGATNQQQLAQVLMGNAAELASQVAQLARAERRKVQKNSTAAHCMGACAQIFRGASMHLRNVDDKLQIISETKYLGALLYLAIRKNDIDQAWNYNCNECQGHPATGDLASTHDKFNMVVDMITALSGHAKKMDAIGQLKAAFGGPVFG